MTAQFSVNATPVSAVGAMPIIGQIGICICAAFRFTVRTLTRSLTGRSNAVSAAKQFIRDGALWSRGYVSISGSFSLVILTLQIAIPNMHRNGFVSNVLASVGVSSSLGAWNTVRTNCK